MNLTAEQKEIKKLRKALTDLTMNVRCGLTKIDSAMSGPSTSERGKVVARICNEIEMANDRVRAFTLGIDYRTDTKGKSCKVSKN